jgi:aurora kinase
MTTPRLRREPAPVRRPPQWCLNDFEMGPSLGEGKFSEVFVAREKKSGTIVSHAGFYVAIKAMNKQFLRDQGLEKQVEREIKLHARYDHPNILQFYGYFTNATTIYLVTELSDQGDLFTYFKQQKDKHLSEK